MICRNCNRVIPDSNSYCMYCGAPVTEELPATMPVGAAPIMTEPVVEPGPGAPYVGTVPLVDDPAVVFPREVPNEAPQEPVAATAPVDYVIPTPPAQQPKTPGVPAVPQGVRGILELGKKFWLPILAAALVVIVILGISMGSLRSRLKEAESALESSGQNYADKISELNDTIRRQKETIGEQEKKIDALQLDAEAYNKIYRAMNDHSMGNAAPHFQASDKLVVVKNGNTNAKFTLVAKWKTATNVDDIIVEYTSPCAMISFDRETWYTDTTLTVIPREPGITIATFRNKNDSETFSVLILVLE